MGAAGDRSSGVAFSEDDPDVAFGDLMLSLFHAPDSRSSRFIWLLEELGVEHEIVYCDIPRRSGRGAPDPRNPHPEKRVPALVHDAESRAKHRQEVNWGMAEAMIGFGGIRIENNVLVTDDGYEVLTADVPV